MRFKYQFDLSNIIEPTNNMRQPSPSEKILKRAQEISRQDSGDYHESISGLEDVRRIDYIVAAILEYLDSYADHSHGE